MPSKLEESWKRGLKSRRYCRPPPRSGPTTRWAPSLPQWLVAMLLIAVLIQPLTQQPRYYLLTTIRQPLRHISWFVPTTRSRLACGSSRPAGTRVAAHDRPVAAGVSASTGTDLATTSSPPRPNDVISAHPASDSRPAPTPPRRLTHVPRSSRCRRCCVLAA